ncbi:hypothetical protein Mapa_014646 [Marchantia paleacea]|nr:hypothetical protein Mapa_014646 [Marchantia paleacea]
MFLTFRLIVVMEFKLFKFKFGNLHLCTLCLLFTDVKTSSRHSSSKRVLAVLWPKPLLDAYVALGGVEEMCTSLYIYRWSDVFIPSSAPGQILGKKGKQVWLRSTSFPFCRCLPNICFSTITYQPFI